MGKGLEAVLPSVTAVCFDLDDTLIDSESGAPERFLAAARAVQLLRPDIPTATIDAVTETALATHPTEGRVANYLRHLRLDAVDSEAVRHAYFDGMAEQVRLADGALEVLAQLRRRYRLAIVTNGPSDLQRAKLRQTDLERFVDVISISGEVGYEKPASELFQAALRELGTQAATTIHVGDSLATDVVGANQSGLRSVWLRSPLLRAVLPIGPQVPHLVIDDLRELIS